MEPKHRFKTNNVNSIFMQTVKDTADPAAGSGHQTGSSASTASSRDSSSPAPGMAPSAGAGSAHSTSTSLSTATGHYKLGKLGAGTKEPKPQETHWGTSSATATKGTASSDAKPWDGTAGEPSGDAKVAEKSTFDMDEEELAKKGIFVAHRYASTTDVNWSDEEDDWQPPSGGSGADPQPKPAAPPSQSAWTRKAEPQQPKSLTDHIRELRKGSGGSQTGSHGPRRSSPFPPPPPPPSQRGPGGSGEGNRDGLSRFRLDRPGMPPPPAVGVPPRGIGGVNTFPGGPPREQLGAMDDEGLDWSAPRRPVAAPIATPPLVHREIPDRFKIKPSAPVTASPEPASISPEFAAKPGAGKNPFGAAKPAATAPIAVHSAEPAPSRISAEFVAKPGAGKNPFGAAGPAAKPAAPPASATVVDGPDAALSAEEFKQQQKELMKQSIAAARARHEAEEKADREREQRLAEIRSQEAERIRKMREEEEQARRERKREKQRAERAAQEHLVDSERAGPSLEGIEHEKRSLREPAVAKPAAKLAPKPAPKPAFEEEDWRLLKKRSGGAAAALAEARERRRAAAATLAGSEDANGSLSPRGAPTHSQELPVPELISISEPTVEPQSSPSANDMPTIKLPGDSYVPQLDLGDSTSGSSPESSPTPAEARLDLPKNGASDQIDPVIDQIHAWTLRRGYVQAMDIVATGSIGTVHGRLFREPRPPRPRDSVQRVRVPGSAESVNLRSSHKH